MGLGDFLNELVGSFSQSIIPPNVASQLSREGIVEIGGSISWD